MISRITFLVLVLVVCVWLYVLTFQVMRAVEHGEGTLDNSDRILWALQQRMATRGLMAWLAEPESPTADPTEPEPDSRRARGRERLRAALAAHAARMPITAPMPAAAPPPVPTRRPEPATPEPTPGPATVPREQVVDDWHRELTAVTPERDDVDLKLARFSFAEGHTR